eukprot:1962168-Pyramimonas_sp.AAC.1
MIPKASSGLITTPQGSSGFFKVLQDSSGSPPRPQGSSGSHRNLWDPKGFFRISLGFLRIPLGS